MDNWSALPPSETVFRGFSFTYNLIFPIFLSPLQKKSSPLFGKEEPSIHVRTIVLRMCELQGSHKMIGAVTAHIGENSKSHDYNNIKLINIIAVCGWLL